MSQVETLIAPDVFPVGATAAKAVEAAERKRTEETAAIDEAIAAATAALQAAALAPPVKAAKPVPNGVAAPVKVAPAPALAHVPTPAPTPVAAPAPTPAPVVAPTPASAPTAPKIVAYGATDVSVIPDQPLEKWLKTHYKEESGEFLSVVQERFRVVIDWSWGPYVLHIVIDFTSISGEFGINIPFFGYKKLAEIHGDLITGVSAGFDIGNASGNIKLYRKGRQVIFEIHAQAFGKKWDRIVILTIL